MMSINMLLITHEPIVQTAIHAVLIDATDIQIVGSATCYQQVYLMDTAHQPDIILLTPHELTTPVETDSAISTSSTGYHTRSHKLTPRPNTQPATLDDACNLLTKRYPSVRFLLLLDPSQVDAYTHIDDSAIAGCQLTSSIDSSLPHIVRTIAAGQTYFSRQVVLRMLAQKTDHTTETMVDQDHEPLDALGPKLGLSKREVDLLMRMDQAQTNDKIANDLCLARKTVRNLTCQLYRKLGVHSRDEAVAWFREQRT